ncbi:MAG: response regulator, partial [bacterium]|nr:response regulator [bacterium]
MYANKKILLVDDESALRRTMTLGLSQHGIDTEPCENGVNALKKLETYIKHNTTLDGIVVDIQLPDINGIKLVKIMKFKYPGVPIILISGHADKYNIDEIQDLQISAFLEKPFSPAELTAQFLEIMAEQQVVEAPAVEEDEATSESAYVLARLENSADFADTHHKLSYMDNVLYCDATKGDYDVIMLVNAPNMEDLRKMTDSINAVPGVESASLLEVANPMLDET